MLKISLHLRSLPRPSIRWLFSSISRPVLCKLAKRRGKITTRKNCPRTRQQPGVTMLAQSVRVKWRLRCRRLLPPKSCKQHGVARCSGRKPQMMRMKNTQRGIKKRRDLVAFGNPKNRRPRRKGFKSHWRIALLALSLRVVSMKSLRVL